MKALPRFALSLLLLASARTAWAEDPTPTPPKTTGMAADVFADLYEHLAASIIEIRATEDNLVKGLLTHYHGSAQRHLVQAANAEGADRAKHLEAAATDVANIANEGDKRVQATRQRLSDAGHYHQQDAETKADYMYINSQEKKGLLALAQRIGSAGAEASADELRKSAAELKTLFDKSIGRE